MICSFIGATAQFDTSKTGGRNPLVDAAQELHIWPRARTGIAADAAVDDPRGEVTGWVSDEEARNMMPAGRSAPALDTIVVDEEQNVVGSELGAEETVDEQALGAAAQPGTFESLMFMFTQAQPANTAPQPPSA